MQTQLVFLCRGAIVRFNGTFAAFNVAFAAFNGTFVGVHGTFVAFNAASVGVHECLVGVNGQSVDVHERCVDADKDLLLFAFQIFLLFLINNVPVKNRVNGFGR